MTAKEYLLQVSKKRMFINHKIQEIKDLRSLLTEAEGLDYSREKIQGGGSCADEKVIRLICLEKELNQLIYRYMTFKHNVIVQIQGLNNINHIRVLYERYITNRKLTDVATRLGYSYQYTKELHGYALQNFQTSYKNLLNDTLQNDTIVSS